MKNQAGARDFLDSGMSAAIENQHHELAMNFAMAIAQSELQRDHVDALIGPVPDDIELADVAMLARLVKTSAPEDCSPQVKLGLLNCCGWPIAYDAKWLWLHHGTSCQKFMARCIEDIVAHMPEEDAAKKIFGLNIFRHLDSKQKPYSCEAMVIKSVVMARQTRLLRLEQFSIALKSFLDAYAKDKRGAAETIAEILTDSSLTEPAVDEMVHILVTKPKSPCFGPCGLPGLHHAFMQGNHETFSRLLAVILRNTALSSEQKVSLLRGTGIFFTIAAVCFKEYFEMEPIDSSSYFQATKIYEDIRDYRWRHDPKNFDVQCARLMKTYIASILASSLPNQDKVRLLASRQALSIKGESHYQIVQALYLAIENGATDSVKTYIETICASQLAEEDKIELCRGQDWENELVLGCIFHWTAFDFGRVNLAFRTYISSVLNSPLSDSAKVLVLKLTPRDDERHSSKFLSRRIPGLQWLMGHNRPIGEIYARIIRDSSLKTSCKKELLGGMECVIQ